MDVVILDNDILVTISDDGIAVSIVPNNITGQAAIVFQDEGVDLGTQGTVTKINFVGAGVVASRSGSTVTVTVSSSGGGGGTWGSITGTLSSQTDLQAALNLKQDTSGKDATGGYAGLTLFAINFKNALNTFTSFFTNANTVARTYTFQDRTGTIADTYLDKIKGSTNNKWHTFQEIGGNNSTVAATINRQRTVPFLVRFPCTLTGLAMEVTTGTTGKIRFGVYADDGTGKPSARSVAAAEQTITAPGVYADTSISVALLPGTYYLSYVADTANTFRAGSFAQVSSSAIMGYPSTLGSNTIDTGYDVAMTYAALPDPHTTLAGGTTVGAAIPFIFYRLS